MSLSDIKNPGAYTGGATPVSIPNTVVKPSWVDGTALAREWESRSVPGFFIIINLSRIIGV